MQRTVESRTILRRRDHAGRRGSEDLADSIVRAVVYYDLFTYPLTTAEIERFIDVSVDDRRVLYDTLEELQRVGVLGEGEGFWYLRERGEEIVRRRLRMERRGIEMWEIAERFARLMRHVPFVRGVMISGQLSRYVADEKSDIDYFIVAEPNRLWVARTILVFLRRTLLLNSRAWFCTNFFVTTDNLGIDERNIYAACETASVKPLWNREIYRQFTCANEWIRDFYPNHTPSPELFMPGIPDRRSRVQRLLESFFPRALTGRLDRRLMLKTRAHWKKKFPTIDPETRARSLRSTPTESRAHAGDYSPVILAKYHRELRERNVLSDRIDWGRREVA